jgi:dTDP-4-amino-4,6-dideoxygalactose transaminase
MYRGLPSANQSNLPVAADAALKVLCLPIYPALSNSDIHRIVSIIEGR